MSKIVVNYKVNGEEWKKAVEEAFDKLNQKVTIDGFRKGHAPRKVFEQKYGQGEILIEASDKLIQNHFYDILNEKNLELAAEPKVDLVKLSNEDLEVNYTFFVNPEVKLGEYKNLKVKKEKVKVTKEEVDHQIHHLLEDYAELISVDRAVKTGDYAIIDYEGFKDGVAFDGGKAENYSLEIGSGTFIPGFEDQVVGMKKGETKDINVTFPEDYHAENLKGAKVVFKVTLHDVKERSVPKLDKDFFDDLGIEGVDSKEKLEETVEKEIKERKEHEAEDKYIDELLKKASNNIEAEIEDEIYEAEIDRIYNQFIERMKMQGIDEDMYFKYTNSSKDVLREQMKEEAQTRVKERYLLMAIAKEQKFEVTMKDAEARVKEMAESYKVSENEIIDAFGGIENIKFDIEMKKSIEYLKECNK